MALTITLDEGVTKGDKFSLKINYETTEGGSALSWLETDQTDSKEQPYVFSQCQSIHCRSIIPF